MSIEQEYQLQLENELQADRDRFGVSYEYIGVTGNSRIDPAKVIVWHRKKTKNQYIQDVKDLIFQHGLSLEDVMLDNYQDEEFRKQHGYGFHPITQQ